MLTKFTLSSLITGILFIPASLFSQSGPVTSSAYSSTTRNQINSALIHLGCTPTGVCAPGTGTFIYPTGTGVVTVTGGASWGTTLTVGTSANNLVQLNSSAKLPAVDGSLLTNLPSGSGTVTTKSGTSDPTGSVSCTAPSPTNLIFYANTATQSTYVCTATDTWRLLFSGTVTDPVEITGLTQSALSTPATNVVRCYFDSTYLTWNCKNSLGDVYTTIKSSTVPSIPSYGTPVSSSAACTTGTVQWDASNIYVCVSTNTWKKAGLSSW